MLTTYIHQDRGKPVSIVLGPINALPPFSGINDAFTRTITINGQYEMVVFANYAGELVFIDKDV